MKTILSPINLNNMERFNLIQDALIEISLFEIHNYSAYCQKIVNCWWESLNKKNFVKLKFPLVLFRMKYSFPGLNGINCVNFW